MNLLLKNIKWMDGKETITADVRIGRGIISEIGDNLTVSKKEKAIDFQNHFLYPGLINSHDHLEMNLYPRMGFPPYNNYTEWARDIYKPKESPVKEIESIPISARLLWGGIKNLISGVTTVVHHNPWHYSLSHGFPIRVLKKFKWAHSVAFEKKSLRKFSDKKNTPFIIHAAEGIDSFARNEITQLNELNILKSNTVLVHAIAVEKNEIDLISESGASVVWCPSSNYFMFNKTANISVLKEKTLIALGSDSTMTGESAFLEEMKAAKKSGEVTQEEIFQMSTTNPEKIFNLSQRRISQGFPADLLIAPIKSKDYHENLFLQDCQSISVVLVGGDIRYCDRELINEIGSKGFFQKVGSTNKWIAYDINKLKSKILATGLKDSFFEKNALWKMLS